MKDIKYLQNKLASDDLRVFVTGNMKESLAKIGFSRGFIEGLTGILGDLEKYSDLQKKYSNELDKVYLDGFFKGIVPNYFRIHVIPEIPASQKVLDLGCGTGILAERMSREDRFSSIIGLELKSYPEWETFVNEKIFFTVADKNGAFKLIEQEKPDSIVITWTLHHMPFAEQKDYMQKIYDVMPYGTRIIILEDSYSEKLAPENGAKRYADFMRLSRQDRKEVMAIYDWLANRVMGKRKTVPVTFTYRTVEEWEDFFQEIGFSVVHKKFIGFPDYRDINTPQSLIVIEKTLVGAKLKKPKLSILQKKTGPEFNHILAFKEVLSDKKLSKYIKDNFIVSLPTIGFSKSFTRDFVNLLGRIEDYRRFREIHQKEISRVHSVIFFQHIVPDLFEKYVIPEVPKSNLVIDIGCGTGFLADKMSHYDRFREIIGIDIVIYPEWQQYLSKKVRFVLLNPDGFSDYIKSRRPDAVIITWTLQHLTLKQQEIYFKKLRAVLKKGTKVVMLDDCFSDKLKPKNGMSISRKFKKFSREDRDNIMYIYDWVANKILAQRDHATVQGSPYSTLEEKENLFDSWGFRTVKKVFIGFTKKRDTNTPLSMIVVEKK